MVGLQEYINKSNQGKPTPKDPYAHATYLISSDNEKISEFHQILNKDIMLATISNDQLLKYYQRDITLLMDLFGMALRDSDMAEVFTVRYYAWLGELGITRTKDGLERKLQASIGQSGYAPRENMLGLGVPAIPQQEQEKNRVNIVKQFFPGQRRREGGNQ